MRKLPRIMQILGILLFLAGSFSSKDGNLLQFIIACPTGLKSDLQ